MYLMHPDYLSSQLRCRWTWFTVLFANLRHQLSRHKYPIGLQTFRGQLEGDVVARAADCQTCSMQAKLSAAAWLGMQASPSLRTSNIEMPDQCGLDSSDVSVSIAPGQPPPAAARAAAAGRAAARAIGMIGRFN
jgi:hypothetical protein